MPASERNCQIYQFISFACCGNGHGLSIQEVLTILQGHSVRTVQIIKGFKQGCSFIEGLFITEEEYWPCVPRVHEKKWLVLWLLE